MLSLERVSYRSVLSNREFTAILFSQALSTLGDQLARIAIALLVFDRTGSGLLAAATFAVSYLVYTAAGPLLSTLSDRHPRLTVMIVCDLLRVPFVLLLCVSDLPLWMVFGLVGLVSVLAPPFDSARSGLQPDLLPGDAYVTGNALMNLVLQLGSVLGFVLGGTTVALVSVQGALALDAATFLLSAGLLTIFVRQRPAAQDAGDRGTLWNDTRQGFRLVRGHPLLRRYLMFAVLGSAALITPEGLAIPVAESLGGGAVAAGVLTAAVPAGFVLGGLLILQVPVDSRDRLLFPLAVLAAVPLLLTPLMSSVPAVAALWLLSGVGGGLQIVASSGYVQACPAAFRSRAYGVAVTAFNASQGAALLLAGSLADLSSPAVAVAAFGAATLVALSLSPALRMPRGQGATEAISQGIEAVGRTSP